ncbi:hypothetical protein N9A47_04540 [Flavobacteriaceae bacterium]|jgi:hypothetical protein|nr:hypothetical protein [Flavobacteriaceae bacterium]MDA7849414.1 hypothetical protein [Flavobacteriaceae bacterium]MDB0004028.1 hypothetical protein [Flavobacteriaceae bacterium]MDG1375056.1 hypothetical protein [Flavobacteriaceae bacterium]
MRKIISIIIVVLFVSCSRNSTSETQFEPEITSFNFEERLPDNMQTDAAIVYFQVLSMQSQMNAVGAFMTTSGLINT